ncbi:MAG TPA: glycosyltransferase family 4 protein [Desulfuromonadales bacterium]|nr:glycosyltransferase family 4 protein [Desulfuromonadales bacterium]
MKIVFLAPFGIRPKGTVIARMLPLAAGLQVLGHEVVIVAPPYTNPEDSGKTELLRGVLLVNVVLPTCGKLCGAFLLTWRMYRAALAENPDIVHLFKPKGYGGLAAMLHISLQRIGIRLAPLFVDTDDWEGNGGMNDLISYSLLEKRLFAFQEQWLTRRSVGVTAASRTLEGLSGNMGVAAERILYLPNGVVATPAGDGARIRHKLHIPAGAPVAVLYTRFFEFDQERLYRVFAGIVRRVPDVRFLVVGKGRKGEEERLEAAACDRGFAEALVMTGWIEPVEIPDYLAAGSVAIYPLDDTMVNRAKCPAKLTELLSAGIPVVADRVGQAHEYIMHGISGTLCDPDAPDQMVDETVRLLQHRETAVQRGSEGKRHILAHFNWSEAAVKLDTFYRSIVTP